MLKNEAVWLQNQLDLLPDAALSPLLSIGSGTSETRNGRQPWIGARVFDPLERRGLDIVHHEFQAGPGVDVVGDLNDPGFLAGLPELGARSVLCCNVLEHVPDPAMLAKALTAAVAPGAYLVVTVPRAYPYHPDPIDTMLRPSVAQLAELFPDLRVVRGEEVPCGTLLSYALSVKGKHTMVANGVRHAMRRDAKGDGENGKAAVPPPAAVPGASPSGYLFRQTKVTCMVLGRPS